MGFELTIFVLNCWLCAVSIPYHNIACTDILKQVAKNQSGLNDILHHDSISYLDSSTISSSQDMLSLSTSYLAKAPDINLSQYLGVLHPNYSGCAWLEVDSIDRAGLGHSIASFVNYLKVSILTNLTLHLSFYTSATHDGTCDLNETAHFFGLHPIFFWARQPPVSAKRVPISPTQHSCDFTKLSEVVTDYRNRYGTNFCRNGDVVFYCYNGKASFRSRIANTMQGGIEVLRAAFNTGYNTHKYKHIHNHMQTSLSMNNLIIAVHIRRGDIMKSKRIDKEHRVVSYKIYSDIIKVLLAEARSHKLTSKAHISIFLLCEGSPDYDTVADYEESNVRIPKYVNVTSDMHDSCNPSNHCHIEVLFNADFYESFTTMCESDVLVTSTSGYAWTASGLCAPPLTISFPWGSKYDGLENVVPVVSSGPLWSSKSSVFVTNISNAWNAMVRLRNQKKLLP